MTKSHLAIATIAVSALLGSSFGFAQTTPPKASSSSTAQVSGPASCGEAVDKAQDNIFLRIQGEGATTRENARVHLLKAGQAADAGNEAQCWMEFGISKQLVR